MPAVGVGAAPAGENIESLTHGNAADVMVPVNSPASNGPLVITKIEAAGSTGGGASGCSAGFVTVPTQTGLAISLPVGNNQLIHLPAAAVLAANAPTECQNLSFNPGVRITASNP